MLIAITYIQLSINLNSKALPLYYEIFRTTLAAPNSLRHGLKPKRKNVPRKIVIKDIEGGIKDRSRSR